MTSSDHSRFEDSAAAYLLGALPDDEAAEFRVHLVTCRTCADEVAHLRVAAESLPIAVEQLDPPPQLRGRIMAIVEREAGVIRSAEDAASGPVVVSQPAADARTSVGRDRIGRLRSAGRRFLSRPGLALPVVAALLVAAVLGITLSGGSSSVPTRTTAATQVDRNMPNLKARIERTGKATELVVSGMLAVPGGRVYQVWLKHGDSDPVPTDALFVPESGGHASVAVPGSLKGVTQVLVTDEPAGGSLKPTGTQVLAARLT